MTKLNPFYKSSVDVAILNGKSHLSLHNVVKTQYNIKKLQKAIRQYAKKMNSEVSTQHDKLYDELVITRKRFDTAKDYLPGVVAEVVGTKVPIIHNVATPSPSIPPVETQKPNTLPYEFKVGDNGKTACGEKYVVVEKRVNQLLVSVESQGIWKFGWRNLDGTCVYNYKNKHRFALIPPEKQLPVVQKRTIYVNVYENYAYCHPTRQTAIEGQTNKAIAVAVPVTFEFTPLR